MSDRLSAQESVDVEEAANELECLPYGVDHNGEGVCLLVRMGPHRILFDCGLTDISPLIKDLKKPATSRYVSTSRLSPNKSRSSRSRSRVTSTTQRFSPVTNLRQRGH